MEDAKWKMKNCEFIHVFHFPSSILHLPSSQELRREELGQDGS
jgi:hypothetical protein